VASEVLEPVSHRQVGFTITKVLRPVFRKNRKLLGLLCRCASETLSAGQAKRRPINAPWSGD
jgi:hypothetical protein